MVPAANPVPSAWPDDTPARMLEIMGKILSASRIQAEWCASMGELLNSTMPHISESTAGARDLIQAQFKLMQNDPDAPDRSADMIKGIAGVAEQVRAASESNIAQLIEGQKLIRAVLDQNKRILSEMLGSAAGAATPDEDEMISQARELMVKYPGLSMSEALHRLEAISSGGYR